MDAKQRTKLSKTLSLVLRHKPGRAGLVLGEGGWVEVAALLEGFAQIDVPLDTDRLDEVVAACPKQRFEFDESRTRIRARQGHSVKVDLGYEAVEPPSELFHGTPTRNLESVLAQGLLRMKRQHVHLSTNRQLMIEVARRYGEPALIRIDAAGMHAADFAFYHTENDVWLTEHVPPAYLELAR